MKSRSKAGFYLSYRHEFKDLAKLALPLVLSQLAQNTVSFVDTLMVGRLGNQALAGIAIGSTVFSFVMIVLAGIILGVSPMVSHATGANDDETCGRAVRQGLWLSVLLFLPAFVFYWNIYPVLIWLQQPEATAQASSEYLRAISWGLLPALWVFALRGLLEGKSNIRPIMMISFGGVALNVLANDVLMFGRFGFPKLGLVGTGYASSFVYSCVFLLLAGYVTQKYGNLKIFSKLRTPDVSMLWELVKLGGPIGMTLAFEASMFSAVAILMGTIGEAQLAAHQIALQSASISFMIPLGVAIAASVRVGQAMGKDAVEEASLAGRVGMISCVAVMCISGLVFWLAPRFIIGLYLDPDAEANLLVVRYATGFLAIAAIFQVADGLQVAGSLALRGLKDTTAAMLITLISYWGVGAVSGITLCYPMRMEGNGLWLGMTLGLATAALLLTWRFQFSIGRARKSGPPSA